MQVVDLESRAKWLKALVYGKPGTGKTGFGVSAPEPLILLNEMQAQPHIRAAQGRVGRKAYGVLHMQCVQDYRNVARAFHGDRTKPFVVRAVGKDGATDSGEVVFERPAWPQTVVLDSLTEALNLIEAEIREESPPKIGKDGLPVDSERYWNVFADRASKLIRTFRDVEANVLFLCLLDLKETGEGEQKVRWVGPQLVMRKLPGVVCAAVNVVGVTKRQLAADKTSVYGISTIGPEYMELKPFHPLRPVEVMDFSSWVQRINGIDDGSVAPTLAPDDSDIVDAKPPVDKDKKPAVKSTAKKAEPTKPAETKPVDKPSTVTDPVPVTTPDVIKPLDEPAQVQKEVA